MFEYPYTAPQVIEPRRYAIISHYDDDSSAVPFVVLEARSSDEALERARRVSRELGVSRLTSNYWQIAEHEGPAPHLCPHYRDEYFCFLESLDARKIGGLH